jgi:hypothetical protein
MSIKGLVVVEDAKYVKESEDVYTEAEPAQAVFQSCMHKFCYLNEINPLLYCNVFEPT